jgi:non-ribosomal peptide synthetase component F
MPFSHTSFDPDTLLRMARAYEAAVAELGQSPESPEQRVALDELANRIIAAAEGGERDVERLKTAALGFTMTISEKR